MAFLGVNAAIAQQKITGTVTSADDGQAIPGVQVVVKGTTIGTTTDLDGNYDLTVNEQAETLVFKFVGMATKEVEIGDRNVINVTLEPDVMDIEGVVVTALGITREQKKLGYSVSTVDEDEIKRSSSTNVLNSLNGKVAGVNISSSSGTAGASSYIEIRGSSSITRGNQPLFIVDGVPINNDQSGGGEVVAGVIESNRAIDLNPEDIKSINVLKGGAATALYGLRAANGAVIITTKSGKRTAGGSLEVNYKTSASFSEVSQLPELQDKYAQGSEIYADLLNSFDLPGQSLAYPDQSWYAGVSWGPAFEDLSYTTDENFVPADFYTGYGDGASSMSDYINKWDPNGRLIQNSVANDLGISTTNTPVQPFDPYEFFQTGLSQKHHLSISSGDEVSTFYFSIGREDNESYIPNDEFNKTSFKLKASRDILKNVTVGASINYVNSGGNRVQQGSNISGLMLGLLRTPPSFDNSNGYEFSDGTQRSYRGGGGYDNPYWTVNKIFYEDNVDRLIGNFNLNWKINDWASLTYRLGTDYFGKKVDYTFSKNSNAFPGGRKERNYDHNMELNSDLLLNIRRELSSDIDMELVLGNNMYQRKFEQALTEANDLVVPDFYNIVNTTDNRGYENNFMKRTAAFYGDLSFSYKDLLYLGATGRQEWSTTMPEGDNSFFYPSVNLGFIFTELPMLEDNDVLSFGKLRASYAQVANDGPAYSTRNNYFSLAAGDGWTNGIQTPFSGTSMFTLGGTIGNRNITPENQISTEIGANLKFFENRLALDVAYFKNDNQDLLLFVPIAPSSGFPQAYLNAASMETTGWEILLTANPIRTPDFQWNFSANFSNPTSEVTSLAEGVPNVFLGGFVSAQIRAVAGEAYRSIYSTGWRETEDGQVVINDDPDDSNMTGFPMQDETMRSLGQIAPDYKIGITNSFTYKGFTVSGLLEIKEGGLMWNGTRGALDFFGTSKGTEDRGKTEVWDGVTGHYNDAGELVHYAEFGNPDSEEIPGPGPANSEEVVVGEEWRWWNGYGSGFTGPSEPYIEETSWVRLRELTVAYELDESLLNNLFLKSAEIYFTGTNLFLSTDYTGVDPESNLYGSDNAQGIDYFNNPGTKTYTFGLRVGL